MNKIRLISLVALNICFYFNSFSQYVKLPDNFPHGHPRLLINNAGKKSLKQLIESEEWAQKASNKSKESIEKYVIQHQTDSSWIVSRLQMYWKSHSTNVYIKGGVYSHADGYAPVPTVRFTGTRDAVTSYSAPKLEDILPYMEDDRGLYYVNKFKSANSLEWVEQHKTGRIIESINRNIMGLAQNAAFLYWETGDLKYGKFAFDLFDTYMMGIYYRNEPIDLNHSHNQTLVGLSSFEVIHEDILNELTFCYDFLYDYIEKTAPHKLKYYAETFKKWADLIIKNGVPFNNWNLIEARFVANIAFVLEDNQAYNDGKGMQYYINEIFNNNHTRQWSIPRLMDYGYDSLTGIWNESPGYAQNVTADFVDFLQLFDKILGVDLLSQMPLLNKAVEVLPQYLYPNGYTVAFGDAYYSRLNMNSFRQMITNAQKYGKKEREIIFTKIFKTLLEMNGEKEKGSESISSRNGIFSMLSNSGFSMSDTIKPLKYKDIVTPSFYAPNVSWFVQRNGFDKKNGLMISQVGSLGNHAHSNGIAMELYGKGYVLAPDAGIGTSYFQPDYKEYYSQFPAHNTVVVDGISAYPEMRSNHAFELQSCYPKSNQKNGFFPLITFSNINFLEPETNSDQNRLMGTIRTSDSTGYYVDIFRSKRKDGKDKRHDYFYHNLGQQLTILDADGKPLELKPSEKLTFADGDMFAYDYLWDKKSIVTSNNINALFKLSIPGNDDIFMNIWMKGAPDREIFVVKSPPCKAMSRGMVPKEVSDLPVPILVARQSGEAWTKPFVAIYEPSTSKEPKSVVSVQVMELQNLVDDFVGLIVDAGNNTKQYILSSTRMDQKIKYNDINFQGTYAVVCEKEGKVQYLFLGNGQSIEKAGFSLKAKGKNTAAVFSILKDGYYFTSHDFVTLIVPDKFKKGKVLLSYKHGVIEGERLKLNKIPSVSFELPAMEYEKIMIFQNNKTSK